MERGDARRIYCRRSAQLTRRQTTSPSVNLSLSPLPEVAVGAAAPLLSFFFLQVNFMGFHVKIKVVAEQMKLLAAVGAAAG
ncbi:uncharacterized protein DS421_18g622170 [Arachis hypogaea]|nr:uncharacterized protein DS421_18g622170 [Arachis hypogaea]